MYKLSAFFAVFLLYTTRCWAIRCYECAQAPQYRCALLLELQENICPDPVNNTEEAKLAGVRNVCIKTLAPYKNTSIIEPFIDRRCGTVGPGRMNTCAQIKAANPNTTCLVCEEESCNQSEKLWINVGVLWVSIALGIFMMKFTF